MDPSLAFDAFVTPEHDLYSFGYILKTIGERLAIPELESTGFKLLRSTLAERTQGGTLCSDRLISDLRGLTFRADRQKRQSISQIDCYELTQYLQTQA